MDTKQTPAPKFDLGIFLSRQVKWVAPAWAALQGLSLDPRLAHVVHEVAAPVIALAVFLAAHFDYAKFDQSLKEWRGALPEAGK